MHAEENSNQNKTKQKTKPKQTKPHTKPKQNPPPLWQPSTETLTCHNYVTFFSNSETKGEVVVPAFDPFSLGLTYKKIL